MYYNTTVSSISLVTLGLLALLYIIIIVLICTTMAAWNWPKYVSSKLKNVNFYNDLND